VVLAGCITPGTAVPTKALPLATSQKQRSNRYAVAGIESAAAVDSFLRALKQAVARNRRAEVAAMISYPLTVSVGKRKAHLSNRKQLLRRYSLVFNNKVRQALARQRGETLFVNQNGVMIGDGEIWFGPQPGGQALRIIAINN
jgi:hypothetical protein